MKKILLLLQFLLLAGMSQAQTNVLKLDIFQPIYSTLAISFEHKLSDRSSFQLGASGTFGFRSDLFVSSYSPSTSGFGITPEYRFYFSKGYAAMEGWYIAPFARYQHLSKRGIGYNGSQGYQSADYQANLDAFGGGAIVGRHWILKRWISLDIFVGPGYAVTSLSSDQPGYTPARGDFVGYFDKTNLDFRCGATFGLAF